MSDTNALLNALHDNAALANQPMLSATEGARVAAVNTSQTVLDVDRFGMRRGRELAAQWAQFATACGDEHGPDNPAADCDHCHGTGTEPAIDELTAADAYTSLFETSPQFAEKPADPSRAAWWRQLMETNEYQRLHRQTCLNPAMAELGAKALCDQWRAYVAEQPEPQTGDPEPGSDGEPLAKTIARMRSTTKAIADAMEAVDTARDVVAGLGMGADGQLDTKALADYFRRVRGDSLLRDILAMAGRMRTLCHALQRQKTQHGRDDTVGVELGGDVARLIPSEIAQLACGIEELELLALDRVARRQAMCRRHRGLERLGRGPIVVCVDESGSMNGPRIIAAKALALTLAWLARQQRRWIALVGFSGGNEGTRVAFPPGRMDQEQLIAWLTHFYAGGTTLDVPLHELPHTYWPEFCAQGLTKGRTDVILITDANVDCPDELRDSYLAWSRAEDVRTYGIVLGQSDAGDIAALAHRYWCIPSLDIDSAAVEQVLSI